MEQLKLHLFPESKGDEVAIWTNPSITAVLTYPHHTTQAKDELKYFRAHKERRTVVLIEATKESQFDATMRYDRNVGCITDAIKYPELVEEVARKEFALPLSDRLYNTYEGFLERVFQSPNFHIMPVFKDSDGNFSLTNYNQAQLQRHVNEKQVVAAGHRCDYIIPDLLQTPDIEYMRRFIQR